MMKYSHIIYVEDDPIDIWNMERICIRHKELELVIVNSFQEMVHHFADHKKQLIITDQFLRGQHFTDCIDLFQDRDYVVLSNVELINDFSGQKPLEVLLKPLEKDMLYGLIYGEEQMTTQQSFHFMESDWSLDIKKEVAGLIQNELLAFLSEAQSLISTKDYEGLHFRVHKLTSKFSFLAMPEAFDLSQEIGGELREGRLTDRSICKLLSYAQTALSLLTAKTKSYESHNN